MRNNEAGGQARLGGAVGGSRLYCSIAGGWVILDLHGRAISHQNYPDGYHWRSCLLST